MFSSEWLTASAYVVRKSPACFFNSLKEKFDDLIQYGAPDLFIYLSICFFPSTTIIALLREICVSCDLAQLISREREAFWPPVTQLLLGFGARTLCKIDRCVCGWISTTGWHKRESILQTSKVSWLTDIIPHTRHCLLFSLIFSAIHFMPIDVIPAWCTKELLVVREIGNRTQQTTEIGFIWSSDKGTAREQRAKPLFGLEKRRRSWRLQARQPINTVFDVKAFHSLWNPPCAKVQNGLSMVKLVLKNKSFQRKKTYAGIELKCYWNSFKWRAKRLYQYYETMTILSRTQNIENQSILLFLKTGKTRERSICSITQKISGKSLRLEQETPIGGIQKGSCCNQGRLIPWVLRKGLE